MVGARWSKRMVLLRFRDLYDFVHLIVTRVSWSISIYNVSFVSV